MKPKVKILLFVIGLILPHLMGILPTIVMSDKIKDMDFYRSGQLSQFDNQTGNATLIIFFIGLLLCIPWLQQQFSKMKKGAILNKLLYFSILLICIIIHFIAVVLVRFLCYAGMGGILP